jgi:Tol biopolymer transport system component
MDLGITTSDTRILLSSDATHIVFSRTDNTSDGPNDAIYRFDIAGKQLTRVTPQSSSGSSPRWLVLDRAILFSCATTKTSRNGPDICEISLDGTGLRTLITDADYPSFSAK